MSVTAARLGSSPVWIDWTNLPHISPDREKISKGWETLKNRFNSGEVGFFQAPSQDSLSQAQASIELAGQIRASGRFSDCLILGIGGSALGPLCLLNALAHRSDRSLRFHFAENPDAVDWNLTLAGLDPSHTLVIAITKSGTTFETMAQFLLALQWLGKERWQSHVVAITDPTKGDLLAFAKEHKIRTLSIAPSIGGRFSVFTPVGLFPAALAGLSVKDFLQGAAQVADHVSRSTPEKNTLAILGQTLIHDFKRRPVHVCMPYSTRLKLIGAWWVQLWGESLGKDLKGFTPISAVGATDQHSILQLLRDGPDDKITCFVAIDSVGDPVQIPKVDLISQMRLSSLTQLQGHSLQELLDTEYRATALVLTRRGRPHFTVKIETLDEKSLGALMMMFATLTAITGTLWDVNPFDQPGVEEGKVYIREFLSESRSARSDETDTQSAVSRLRRSSEEPS